MYSTLLGPRILRWFLYFGKIYAPLLLSVGFISYRLNHPSL